VKHRRQIVKPLGLGADITRRDFIGGTLVSAGAALLQVPRSSRAQGLRSDWTGYGGVGDYRFSNGNTADVLNSAHRIRDGAYATDLSGVVDTGEHYDAVIVGGGFSGIAAQYEFCKRKPQGACLLLDNQAIFGGFAKSNEFDVDGHRVMGPQASINFFLPQPSEAQNAYWRELGLPDRFEFARAEGGDRSIVFPKGTSAPLFFGEQCASVGYYFRNELTQGKGQWIKDIWDGDLARALWPESFKKDLRALRDWSRRPPDEKDKEYSKWLDSMSFAELVTRVLGLSEQALSYVAPQMGMSGCSPQISAYASEGIIGRFPAGSPQAAAGERWMSFPGGNATILRHFVKAIFPEAIRGPKTFEAIVSNTVDLSALDRADSGRRMRLGATVVRVSHDGKPQASDHVSVVYEKSGRLYRVKAKGTVLAIGGWVAKHIVSDLPNSYRAAFDQFFYGPILMVNVALRNWRFLDKLGISAARWFDGFGFYGVIRQPMMIGNRPPPFHPDKPIVMTLYVPIQRNDLPLVAQGPAGRAELYSTSYVDYERRIVAQMQQMFSAGGFDARRDIAGIVLNRWGHAMIAPPPGFYFGKDGKPPPREVLRRPFGRISFGHSELGDLDWQGATTEGKRAILEVLQTI